MADHTVINRLHSLHTCITRGLSSKCLQFTDIPYVPFKLQQPIRMNYIFMQYFTLFIFSFIFHHGASFQRIWDVPSLFSVELAGQMERFRFR